MSDDFYQFGASPKPFELNDILVGKRNSTEYALHQEIQRIENDSSKYNRADLSRVFNNCLALLLDLTESEYGFIGEVLQDAVGRPYLKTYALTNIAWDKQSQKFFAENSPKGLEFTNMDSLFGYTLTAEQAVISNDAPNDPKAGGIPVGHPPLNRYLGLPAFAGGQMVGMAGLANREAGYNLELLRFLHPVMESAGQLMALALSRR